MNLGKRIVTIRKERKMSQEDFAELFNVTRQTISSWENSKSYPDIETIVKISDKFNISLDILLREDKNMIETYKNDSKQKKIFRICQKMPEKKLMMLKIVQNKQKKTFKTFQKIKMN